MNKFLRWAAALTLVIGNSACDYDWQEPPPMATEKFAQAYVGLLQATVGDSLAPARADSVLQAHRVTREDFETASRYYSAKAERWAEVLKLVVAQLDSQATSAMRPAPKAYE